jgi:hypothetical protein
MLMVVKKLGGRADCPKCQRRVLEVGDRYVCTGRSGCARGPVPTSGSYEECASGDRIVRALALLDRAGDAAAEALMKGEAAVTMWHPIETAPKDGAQFLAITKYGDATYPVKWDVDRQMWVQYGLDGFDTMAWIRAERFDQWMPIPEPPPR